MFQRLFRNIVNIYMKTFVRRLICNLTPQYAGAGDHNVSIIHTCILLEASIFLVRSSKNDDQDGRPVRRRARITLHVHLLAAKPLAFTRLASLIEASMLSTLHSRG